MRLFWVKFKRTKNAFRMARFEYKEFIIIYKAKIAARGNLISQCTSYRSADPLDFDLHCEAKTRFPWKFHAYCSCLFTKPPTYSEQVFLRRKQYCIGVFQCVFCYCCRTMFS